ncbi:iron-containing redox enzyme family protein [soil metagenome]
MKLPRARGPVSTAVFERILQARDVLAGPLRVELASGDPIEDDDPQMTPWALYELHYRSFEDVDEGWEWAPELLAVREQLEAPFERALREEVRPQVAAVVGAPGDLADRLFALTDSFEGPSLAEHIQRHATREQVQEFLLHRSVYQLKEADPHTWVIPRLEPDIKARLVELQFDEYGGGRPARVHQALYARALIEAGLDASYGAYVDDVPAITLALSNATSLFGLHRRLRAAALGHLGAVEATSSIPCRRFAAGIRRTGFSDPVAFFFDEHVEADAVHEQLALRGICAELVKATPGLEADVVFGATACLTLEARFAARLLEAWNNEEHVVPPPRQEAQVPA